MTLLDNRTLRQKIRDILYPDGDLDHEWSSDELPRIAELVAEDPQEPDERALRLAARVTEAVKEDGNNG
jgi:hypothetical protein